MGKKDKRRNKVKKFVQNKQKHDKPKNASLPNGTSNRNTPHIQTIIHNLNTTSSSPDDCTITENTPLNAVTDSYESITPINNSVNNSVNNSPPPPSLHLQQTNNTNNNTMSSTISIHESARNSTLEHSIDDVVTGTSALPPSRQASLAPVDSIDPEIQNVETIPALDLNDSEQSISHASTKSLRSSNSLTQTRKWLSIGVIYLVAVIIGCDLGNIWLNQSKISSQFHQYYNTLQLLLFYVLGFWIKGHFQFNFAIQTSVIIVSLLQVIAYIIMTLTNSFHILLVSRLIAGLSTGLFFSQTLKFFEAIGSLNFKVPFHVIIGLLIVSLVKLNDWRCFSWYLVSLNSVVIIASFVILPFKKDRVELPSNVINKKNTILLMHYIVFQFVLSFTSISYAPIILLLIVVPFYVYWDKTAKYCQFLLDRHQDKKNIILRTSILLFTTMVLYSTPIYLDIFDEMTSIISWILFGGLVGMILYKTPFRIALSLLIFAMIAGITIVSLFSHTHLLSKILISTGVGCLTILSLNVNPLQRESHNNFTFEVIIVLIGLVVSDLLVHGYTKCLIHDKLIKLVTKKHQYKEIVKMITRSDRSLDWIKTNSPKYVYKAIKSCYRKSLHVAGSVATSVFVIAFVLKIITK